MVLRIITIKVTSILQEIQRIENQKLPRKCRKRLEQREGALKDKPDSCDKYTAKRNLEGHTEIGSQTKMWCLLQNSRLHMKSIKILEKQYSGYIRLH